MIDWTLPSWTGSTLLHDQVIKWTKSKVHVYTDSVLCLGKMQDHSGAKQKCTAQFEKFQQSNSFRAWLRIDGDPIEFKENIFPDFTLLEIFQKIQKNLQDQVKNYGKIFSRGLWSFNDPKDEQSWYGTRTYKLQRKWNSIAAEMTGHFQEVGHQ